MSTTSDAEIENIVRLVVDRLRSSASNCVLQLPGKVISIRDLEGRLQGVRQIRIRPDALLTPSVRDELSRRSISIERIENETEAQVAQAVQAHRASQKQLRIITAAHRSPLLQSMLVGCTFQVEPRDRKVSEIADELNAVWDTGHSAIWVTAQPYAASIAIARLTPAFIRTIILHDLADLEGALEQADPNLLILDDKRWTTNQVALAARIWARQVEST